MTAIATILALMPLGLGLSSGTIIASELATVVIGGLFTSTFLTLIVVPVVYSLVEDAKNRTRLAFGLAPEHAGDRGAVAGVVANAMAAAGATASVAAAGVAAKPKPVAKPAAKPRPAAKPKTKG
jgi:hypothetical protein